MNHLSNEQLSALLSQYLDGALDAEATRNLEDYLARNAEARRQLDELRRVKHLLASKSSVPSNPHFWTRVKARIEERTREGEHLLPFPRKYIPAVSVLGVVSLVAIVTVVFLRREPLLEYFSERSQAVKEAYESGVLRGSILPLFADVTDDDVLQFAMYGTLPLGKDSETALRVDEASEQGYKIEVGLTAEARPHAVTVNDLVDEVQPTVSQVREIRTVLDEARMRIEKAAFYAENNALAIDPELTQMNRTVLSNIVAVLEPAQRRRLDDFLMKRNAPFALASEGLSAPAPRKTPVPLERRAVAARNYVVITEDSVLVTGIEVDLERVFADPPPQPPVHAGHLQERLERFVRSQGPRRVITTSGVKAPVRVTSAEDFFKIEMDPSVVKARTEAAKRAWVTARERREKFFRFEFRSGEGEARVVGVPGPDGEFEFKVSIQADSLTKRIHEEQRRRLDEFRLMDSIMRQELGRTGVRAPHPPRIRRSDTTGIPDSPRPPRQE